MSKINKNGRLDHIAKCKALTGSAVKRLRHYIRITYVSSSYFCMFAKFVCRLS